MNTCNRAKYISGHKDMTKSNVLALVELAVELCLHFEVVGCLLSPEEVQKFVSALVAVELDSSLDSSKATKDHAHAAQDQR